MCQWIAEEGNDAVAEALEYVTLVARHTDRAGVFVTTDDALKHFGINAGCELREAHHVAEQHGQLAAFAPGDRGCGGAGRWLSCLCAIQFGDRFEEFLAMSERYAEILQIFFAKYAQDVEVDVVVNENLRVLLEAKCFEPTRDGLHLPLPRGLLLTLAAPYLSSSAPVE